ncbi:uncharacterized protein LOC129944119 isoform X1 [Eupeodes corollae]|uniref:uncharacterized protein LOC129944119 isoform X1 n=1 Tax=Eupeodes corollae TaxID=290404 RepID=UPI0024914CF0|nr:uncharacterized protein LOC129944119 isoform X1 [Eupeodes corollae]
MSEDNQENGASNGDVPEIELIIKDEPKFIEVSESEEDCVLPKEPDPLLQPVLAVCSENDQYILYELKTIRQPSCSFIVTNPIQPPFPQCARQIDVPTCDSIVSTVTQVIATPGPYTISVEIPVETDQMVNKCKENSPKTKRALAKTKRALARERLDDAVAAVINEEMTIGKAAKEFEVTKSTLWKEVNKYSDQRKKKVNEDLNKKIVDRICAGESLSEISRSLKVSKSTVHLHKVRLAQAGKLPSSVSFKPPVDKVEQLEIKNRLIRAFRAVRVNGMSLRLASSYFSVPRSTLWKHIRRCKANQKKQEKAQLGNDPEKSMNDSLKKIDLKESSENEVDSSDENSSNEVENDEDVCVTGENTSDVQSTTTADDFQDDFDLLDFYCEQNNPSEEGDFLISFDFETFEDYVKTDLKR